MASTAFAIDIREDRRHWISRPSDAYVEFEHPRPNGPRWRFELLNISKSGICFEVVAGFSGASRSSNLSDFVVCIGERELRGGFVVAHVSQVVDGCSICGGQFRPATESERAIWAALIAEIEAPPVPESTALP